MGNCVFITHNQKRSSSTTTAKLVVHDGRIEEFSYPVKVSYLLQLYPACFICDSDEMAFDDVVTAVHEDEELRLGQLYFALPLTRLKRHLPPQEMAALAVVATSALAKCGSRRRQIVLFSADGHAKTSRKVASDGGAPVFNHVAKKGRSITVGRGRGKFTASLTTIQEQG